MPDCPKQTGMYNCTLCSAQQNGKTRVLIDIHYFFPDVLANFHIFAGSNFIENVTEMQNKISKKACKNKDLKDVWTSSLGILLELLLLCLFIYFNF